MPLVPPNLSVEQFSGTPAPLNLTPVANYIWSTTLFMWIMDTGTGGGGGGAVTIADGADVAEGSTGDAAVTGDNPGTVSAKLRGINKILFDVWDSVAHWFRVGASQVGAWSVSILGTVGVTQSTSPWVISGSVTQGAPPWAVSVADGADVAEGATTDAAVTGDTPGTVSAKLRGLLKIFTDVWDAANHGLNVFIKNSSPISVTNTPIAIASTTGTLAALDDTVTASTTSRQGMTRFSIRNGSNETPQLWQGSIVFEAQIAAFGSWIGILAFDVKKNAWVGSTSSNGMFLLNDNSFSTVRVRAQAWVVGSTADVAIVDSLANSAQYVFVGNLPANAAQETGGNLDTIRLALESLVILNRQQLAVSAAILQTLGDIVASGPADVEDDAADSLTLQ